MFLLIWKPIRWFLEVSVQGDVCHGCRLGPNHGLFGPLAAMRYIDNVLACTTSELCPISCLMHTVQVQRHPCSFWGLASRQEHEQQSACSQAHLLCSQVHQRLCVCHTAPTAPCRAPHYSK